MIFKIKSNPHILGIDLPNCENNTKSVQHADDTMVSIKDKNHTNTLIKKQIYLEKILVQKLIKIRQKS